MIRIKTLIVAVVAMLAMTVLVSAGPADADADYARTAAKAQRFFEQGEWLNANAMYLLMLDARPAEASTYSHAVISNIMAGDTAAVVRLLEQSMKHNVPIDTLLNNVQSLSTKAGISDLYERLLIALRGHFPWMQRGLNLYLLKYYDFRDNGPEMVHYATLMLNGKPGDLDFMRVLARGYMLQGQYDDAVKTWSDILEDHPDNYDTLIDLGNYLWTSGKQDDAIPYLQRAQAIRPTPYVDKLLKGY